MKQKILFLAILLMILFTTTATAEIVVIGEKEKGDLITSIEETGQDIYSWQKMPEPTTKKMLTLYTYRLSNGKKEYLKLTDNYTIYTENGQLAILPINNNGNINDLSTLKNKDNFNKMFDIYPNTHNHTGGSFPSQYGYSYPTKYPSIPQVNSSLWGVSNWNFKTQTSGKTELDPIPDPKEQFWTAPNLADGNFRYVMSIDGTYQNTFSFGQDIKGTYYPTTRMVEHPWEYNLFDIQEGYFNKLFKQEFLITGKVADKWINWYSQFEKENYKLESTMAIKAQENGLVGTLENRTYMFFNYFAVHSVGTYYTAGYAEEIHGQNGIYNYANLNTTMLSSADNLRVASPEYPIGPINSIEIFDQETGKKLNQETDVLKVGQKLIKKTYVAYESSLGDIPTFNKPIQINSMILYNDNENLSYADEFYPLRDSTNHKNNKLYPVSEGLNISGGIITADKLLNIAVYEEELIVAEKDKNGKFIEKWSSYSVFPYQKGFYRSDNIEENDNQNPDDDISKITFRVENKHTRDLAVSSMKLTDLSGNEVESVIKGQKYKLTYTFKNVGEEQTQTPINSGLYTNNLQGQYYSDSRNLGNNVAGANVYLAKGQENTFTVEIDVPLNTTENVLSLYAFIPKKYDDTHDNVFIREDDVKKIEVPIKSPSGASNENLAIVDIKLFNHKTNQEYNVENKDGTFNFDLNKSYRIEVKVQKTAGTAVLNNPELILNIRDSYGNVQEYILKSSKSFKNVGDTIIFKTGQFVENGNLLDVHAKIPSEYGEQGLNDISTDDQMVKTWQKSVNLSILSAEIIPNRFVFSENADNPPIDLPFKTTFGIDNTDNEYIEPALATIHNSNNKIVFSQRDISFTEGQTLITYYGTIPNQQLKDGNNPYKFTINGDKSIFEYDGTDNPYRDNSLTANVFVERKKTPQKEQLVCDSYNKENNWSVTFKLVRRNGYWTTKTIKTESGTETIDVCRTTSIDRWEETRSYYERFGVEKIMFRSPSTIDKYNNVNDGWVDILGNNKGIVRAGQWYEFFVITRYNTNRVNIPAVPYGECGGSRTPNLSSVYSSNLIQLKMEGYGDSELHMLNSYDTKGSWSNLRRYFRPPLTNGKDAFNETTTRRYLPVTAENGRIDISIITQVMNGYYYDQNHSREKLQDCVSASIYIQNPLPIRTQQLN